MIFWVFISAVFGPIKAKLTLKKFLIKQVYPDIFMLFMVYLRLCLFLELTSETQFRANQGTKIFSETANNRCLIESS